MQQPQQAGLPTPFLQSSLWSEFQESIGNKAHYLCADGWSCRLVEKSTSLGKYFFAPYGPVLASPNDLSPAIKAIRAVAIHQGASWLRLEPIVGSGDPAQLKRQLDATGCMPAPRDIDPPATRVIDLSPRVEELLTSLSQTTRNRIRKNEREATVSFKTSDEPADITIFTTMLDNVAVRHGVSFFQKNYFEAQARYLMPRRAMQLELAYSSGRPLGSAIIHDWGETAYYTYAASLPEARDKDVSGLLLWRAILNAKERGIKTFDLFGVAPADADSNHPWYGFSTFKEKFGGQIVEYAGTWDLPLSRRYRLYRAARGLRATLLRR